MTPRHPFVEVLPGPGLLADHPLDGRFCVVIDVLRACTTIAFALEAGARGVIPVATVEAAMRLGQSLGRDDTLLAGEVRSLRVEGFDLGNSPGEFRPEIVSGKTVVLCTTNGARSLASLVSARDCAAAAFVNLGACARRVAAAEHVTIVCAGSGASLSLEDFACAGGLVEAIAAEAGGVVGDDGARTARDIWSRHGADLAGFLRETDHGRALEQLGFGADVAIAAQLDALASVPMLRDGRLVVERAPAVASPAR